ncbi:MAG: transporter [Burkholderiales bacterium]
MTPAAPIVTPTAPAAIPVAPAPTPTGTASAAAVRDALGKQSTDVDQTSQLLKQTLTAVDKDYTLIKRGSIQVTYDVNYTYIGQQTITTDLASGNATLFAIENTNSHTIVNTFSVDYGLLNNLTGNFTLPIVSKYAQTAIVNGVSNGFGDISLGARFQPFEAQRDKPSLTLTGRLGLPTGNSPFHGIAGSGLATGGGVVSLSGGLNVNQIVDPVALFGSLNLTYSLPAKGLNQVLSSSTLTEVKPGMTVGFGGGFAYALSYMITTSFSFQESISGASRLSFTNGASNLTATSTSAVMSFGIGYRVTPKTTINTSIGIGLTANSPNLSIDVTMPISF